MAQIHRVAHAFLHANGVIIGYPPTRRRQAGFAFTVTHEGETIALENRKAAYAYGFACLDIDCPGDILKRKK
jgi:hypothetical protein